MALTMGHTRLVEAHERAVKLALGELEKFTACRVRRGEAAWSNDTRLQQRGYKKHTLRVWFAHYQPAKLLVPLSTWAVPANRGEVLFLYPSLRECRRRLSWLPQWVVGDLAYISLPIARRIRQEMDLAVITRLKKDMHLCAPYTEQGLVCCHQTLLCSPQSTPPFWELTPEQLQFSL